MADSVLGHAVPPASLIRSTSKDNNNALATSALVVTSSCPSTRRPTTRASIHNNNKDATTVIIDEHQTLDVNDVEAVEMKRRRADRCDSSESSDSGVASLACSDASPWSSGSDITDPMSPDSLSSQPSPQQQQGSENIIVTTPTETLPACRRRRHSDPSSQEQDSCKRIRRTSGTNRPRQSWPQQLKITEFFSTQVKTNWSYSKFSAKGLHKQDLPAEPRVSIVSVAHVEPSCPATILPPPVIRFPVDTTKEVAKNSAEAVSNIPDVIHCLWLNCSTELSAGQSLLEHIQSVHVAPQVPEQQESSPSELYACQWEGCKVQGRKCSSRSWLERHVLVHGGYKPFRCIVDSCEQRFNSQMALERHVNAHFNQDSGHQGGAGSNGLKKENALAKIARKNSKKLKNRRCIATPARLCDYFDAGIMERLQHQLISSHVNQNRLGLSLSSGKLTFSSQVIGRRLDNDGCPRVLIRWTPPDLLPDQWVTEDQVVSSKSVPVHSLSPASQIRLQEELTGPVVARPKQRRK